MSIKKFVIGTAIAAAGLCGGSVAASDYPPDVAPESTVLASGQDISTDSGTPVAAIQRPTAQLPETGSDTSAMIKIAGGAVVAGAGLLVVTRRRRQPVPS